MILWKGITKDYMMILLSIVLFMCCSEKNKSSDSAELERDCYTLTVEECVNKRECYVTTAQEMVIDESGSFCIDWEAEMEDVGCAGQTTSLAVETYAAPPEAPESCWYFRGATIPEGWLDCENVMGECSS